MDEILYEIVMHETGTVSTVELNKFDTENFETNTTEYTERVEISGVSDEVLTIHGVGPGKNSDGVTRLIYKNPNGFNSRISNNEKLEKTKEIIDELEADLVAYSEHRLNCKHKDNRNGFSQMFRGGEAEIKTVAVHNANENVDRTQEGGTSLLCYGPLIEQYDFEHSGKDGTGLGRWVVMGGMVTRVICGYNPCYNKKK